MVAKISNIFEVLEIPDKNLGSTVDAGPELRMKKYESTPAPCDPVCNIMVAISGFKRVMITSVYSKDIM